MEKVKLEDLSQDSLFHFSHKKALESIEQEGLRAQIGENAFGIEKTPKVFFSKGDLGIIKVTEVWLRWLLNRIYGPKDRLGMFEKLSSEENKERIRIWTKEFLSGEYKNDSEKQEVLFEYFYDYLENRRYFVLDLEEGKEYSSDDIDENKKQLHTRPEIDSLYANIMYGEFSDMSIDKMDDWNMHTKAGVSNIPPKKIRQVISKEGKEDMLSIVLELYDKYKGIPHNRMLIDNFVRYVKKRKELDLIVYGENDKNDQINYSREDKRRISS